MEELLNAINKALSYVNIVQCACDQQRALLEQALYKEYQQYVKEWNRKEAVKEVKESENIESAQDTNEVQEDFNILALEELALADNLLLRARRIREKYKVPSFDEDLVNSGEVDVVNFSSTNGDKPKPSSCKMHMVKTIKQSTSLPVMNPTKSRIPNAAISHRTLKEQRIRSNDSISKDRIPRSKVLTSTDRAVITRSQLNSYKELCAKSSVRTVPQSTNQVKKKPSLKIISTLDNVAEKPGGNKSSKTHLQTVPKKYVKLPISSLQEKCQPTYKDFLKLSQETKHPNFTESFWYPFLNPTNVSRLTANIAFTSAKESQQIYTLLLSIQETVFWLDLFSILGKDVMPHLNTKQRDDAVLCSYVQSIFHPRLRRKPMIIESSFNS